MRCIFLFFIFFKSLLFSLEYPNKPIEFVVGLGEGGSSDRMTRNMAVLLEEELGVTINVINIKGNSSLDAAKYVLNQKPNGYTVFSSAFSPHFLNEIISKNAKFYLDQFEIINLQWFDFESIIVDKSSSFNSIMQVIEHIKNSPEKLNIGVINKSSGHLIIKLLLEKFNINFEKINLKLYKGGEKARKALFDSKVDLLIIAAQGNEKYRERIKPLTIMSPHRSKRWDAPTLNEAIKRSGIVMPLISGSIRGMAVPKEFKQKYPNRFKILKKAIQKTLAKKSVHRYLKRKNIGYTWIGSQTSTEILKNSLEDFEKYNYLIKD
ncbi:tripartite tricarboxylate transporter substrate-binding protein [Arcobacter sp. CECT 8983]|uniref:tripartite tricarboxylate transporter substrate-binding protein n=1 Tax=Arcobacter sp. CECT 8983 TaxID=2044508 RepID=UPI00100AE3B7|nr:tripartite tricarboxylate transporter substrate-binding protein [Arcobacter sp. CECT 8983]RXJ89747.1 tripartite tricarboxylate transporter substrate-binding protein [Arcobacter sp. CECT 8983]